MLLVFIYSFQKLSFGHKYRIRLLYLQQNGNNYTSLVLLAFKDDSINFLHLLASLSLSIFQYVLQLDFRLRTV